jgi:hypothetical protein
VQAGMHAARHRLTDGADRSRRLGRRHRLPVLRTMFPKLILTTASVGEAMLGVARNGARRSVLETADIYAAARRRSLPGSVPLAATPDKREQS